MGLILPTPSPSPSPSPSPPFLPALPSNTPYLGLGVSPGLIFFLVFCYLFMLCGIPIGACIANRREKRREALEGPYFDDVPRWGTSASLPAAHEEPKIDSGDEEYAFRFGRERPKPKKEVRWAGLKELQLVTRQDDIQQSRRSTVGPSEFESIPLTTMPSTAGSRSSLIPKPKTQSWISGVAEGVRDHRRWI